MRIKKLELELMSATLTKSALILRTEEPPLIICSEHVTAREKERLLSTHTLILLF